MLQVNNGNNKRGEKGDIKKAIKVISTQHLQLLTITKLLSIQLEPRWLFGIITNYNQAASRPTNQQVYINADCGPILLNMVELE